MTGKGRVARIVRGAATGRGPAAGRPGRPAPPLLGRAIRPGSAPDRRDRSGAARAGEEHLAVQVHVELDRGEPAWRRVDDPAERGETPFGRARPPRVADVVVRAVLSLADPLAARLRGGGVGAEGIPAARGPAGQPG